MARLADGTLPALCHTVDYEGSHDAAAPKE